MHGDRSDADQLGFDLGVTARPGRSGPDPDEVREDAQSMLASARAVTADAPWDERTFRYNKIVFTRMTCWLPDDERDQLCFEFLRELERIELLMAA